MATLAFIGGGVLGLSVLVWLVFRLGRSAGIREGQDEVIKEHEKHRRKSTQEAIDRLNRLRKKQGKTEVPESWDEVQKIRNQGKNIKIE